jgi:hypothetical protein
MKSLTEIILPAVVCLSLACGNLTAQTQKTWQWINQLGGKAWDISTGLACDSKNHIYVLGNFSDTLISENRKTASAGSQDIFLVRYSERGKLADLWRFGGESYDQANCFALSNNDNILIGGSSGSPSQDNTSKNASEKKLFVSSISNKGDILWKSFLTPENEASLFLLSIDDAGNTYVAGIFTGNLLTEDTTLVSNGKKDIFLAHFNQEGSLKKIVSFGGEGDDNPSSLLATSDIVYLSGTFEKSFSVNTTVLASNHGNTHGFVLGFTPILKSCWKKQLDGEQYLHIGSMQKDAEDNLYIAGSFDLDLFLENVSLRSQGHTDGFIFKVDRLGNCLWKKSFGTGQYDYAQHLIKDNLDGMILTGVLGDTLEIDEQIILPRSENSALALQYNSTGSVIWGDCVSGEGSNFGDASVIDRKGNLYLAGSFSGRFDMENLKLSSKGDQDLFVAKYYNCSESQDEILGNGFLCPGSTTELSVKPEYTKILWNDSIRDVHSIAVVSPGTYSVTMYDKHGCMMTDTIEVSLIKLPLFSLGNDVSLPVESSLTLKAPEKFKHYQWQDLSSESTLVAKAENSIPGKYLFWLSAYDSLGCQTSDSMTIDFYRSTTWIDAKGVKISYYPNPVSEWLTWSINSRFPCQLNLEILDDNGKTVYNEHIGYYEPGTEMKLGFAHFASGAYYLQIKDGAGNGSNTVCVVKQ